MRQIIFILLIMFLASCSPRVIASQEHTTNDISDKYTQSREQLTELRTLTAAAITVSDNSIIRITYFDTAGRKTAEAEIIKDIITSKDSTVSEVVVLKDSSTVTQEHTDNSIVDVEVKEKTPLSWLIKALMWCGVVSILYFILKIVLRNVK